MKTRIRYWYWRLRGNRRKAGAIAGWATRRAPKVFSYVIEPKPMLDGGLVGGGLPHETPSN